MQEWLNWLAWKACVRETVPWVRIPLSPQKPLGRVREWLNRPVSKTGVAARLSRVRIPPLPLTFKAADTPNLIHQCRRRSFMKHLLISFFLYACFSPSFLHGQSVVVLKLEGMVDPASADYLQHGIEQAQDQHAECVVVQLNTPGGLLTSTRAIVRSFLESEIPIVVYVSPGGAHAGSAGAFITMAAHIAAMAPGTNIGAAHPVDMQGKTDSVMNEKVTNDAAAFIRTIAEKRKRNLAWAEEAVRESKAITETEALQKNVIDCIAKNLDSLLIQIDGKQVETAAGIRTIHTRGSSVHVIEMDFTEKFLDTLSDPNITYILFMLGIFGLLFELYNPGLIFPGIVGVVSMTLALYSMQTLPINYAGLGLIVFGVILFVLEIKITSHGMLTAGGILSLILGSLMLIRVHSALEVVELSWSVVALTVIATAAFFIFLIGLGLRAQRLKPVNGQEAIIGMTGETAEVLNPSGTIHIRGEIWNAVSISGKIARGTAVRVVRIENLTLSVEPLPQKKE